MSKDEKTEQLDPLSPDEITVPSETDDDSEQVDFSDLFNSSGFIEKAIAVLNTLIGWSRVVVFVFLFFAFLYICILGWHYVDPGPRLPDDLLRGIVAGFILLVGVSMVVALFAAFAYIAIRFFERANQDDL